MDELGGPMTFNHYPIDGITQEPMDGISLAYLFDDTNAESKRTTQYFEMFANRAICDNG